jgi:DNA-binding response OmpR family regulator
MAEYNIGFKKNILLVDDESDIAFTLKYVLEIHGFKVDSFYGSCYSIKKSIKSKKRLNYTIKKS